MTREECEAKIVELMREIYETYKQYNPVGDYLALFLIGDALMGNNAYYDIKSIDYEKNIDFYKKLSDGEEDDEAQKIEKTYQNCAVCACDSCIIVLDDDCMGSWCG